MQNGDYGLSKTKGLLGFLISFGQLTIGDASRYQHAFVVVDVENDLVIEARPGGAGYQKLSTYEGRAAYSHIPLTDIQRERIVAAAKTCIGVKYNWLDYLALALLHLGIRPKWLTKFVSRKDRMICSQLVDEVYYRARIHLFTDGRFPQDVTPGDLTYVGNVY